MLRPTAVLGRPDSVPGSRVVPSEQTCGERPLEAGEGAAEREASPAEGIWPYWLGSRLQGDELSLRRRTGRVLARIPGRRCPDDASAGASCPGRASPAGLGAASILFREKHLDPRRPQEAQGPVACTGNSGRSVEEKPGLLQQLLGRRLSSACRLQARVSLAPRQEAVHATRQLPRTRNSPALLPSSVTQQLNLPVLRRQFSPVRLASPLKRV